MGLFSDIFGGGSKQNNASFVDPNQQPFLSDIYNRAQGLFNQYGQAQQNAGFSQSGSLYGQGQGLMSQLAQSGQGVYQGNLQQLAQMGGGGNAGGALAPFTGSGFVNDQISSLSDILNRNLSFNLNNIQNRFGMAGSTGSRAGVTGATALGDTQLALSQGVTDIFNNDLMRRQQAAGQMAGYNLQGQLGNRSLQTQAAQGLGGVQLGIGGLQQDAAMGGLSQLGGLFNLGMAGYNNAYAGLGNYANLVGGPTVLGQGSSNTKGGFFAPISLGFEL